DAVQRLDGGLPLAVAAMQIRCGDDLAPMIDSAHRPEGSGTRLAAGRRQIGLHVSVRTFRVRAVLRPAHASIVRVRHAPSVRNTASQPAITSRAVVELNVTDCPPGPRPPPKLTGLKWSIASRSTSWRELPSELMSVRIGLAISCQPIRTTSAAGFDAVSEENPTATAQMTAVESSVKPSPLSIAAASGVGAPSARE